MRRTDIVTAGLFIVIGLVTIVYVIPTYVMGGTDSDDLSPAFMPYVAAVIATVAATGLLVTRLVRRSAQEEPTPLPWESWLFLAASVVVLGVTFVLMDRVGYLWGAASVVGGFMLLARAPAGIIVGTAIAFPVALWLLFDKLLGFPLP